MNPIKTCSLAATLLVTAGLMAPAQAAPRGGWDGNGVSISGMAPGVTQAAGGLASQVRSIELASPVIQGGTPK
jgi:hypothetical protein